jgi:23S rRNA pseudouridine1911/1915/1917 synthase
LSSRLFQIDGIDDRIDRYLASALGESRNQIEQLIKSGVVKVDGKTVQKTGFKLLKSRTIEIEFPEMVETQSQYSVDFDVPIIYEDEYLLVVNKPADLVVHSAPSVREATLVDWLKHRGISLSTISGEERHGIVHRLDKGTTGAMVIAKDNETHRDLSRQLSDRTMGRYYLAIINIPLKDDRVVEAPIGRNPQNRLKMGVVESGKQAKTLFKKIALSRDEKRELIGAKLYTGRTHQIRVHLSTLGRYIIGDNLYGFKPKKDTINNIQLHAHTIYFIHPKSGERLEIDAEVSPSMLSYINENFSLELKNGKFENLPNIFNPSTSSGVQ